jgi:tetratricopeptide (TPR) repeat protein
MDLDHIRRVIGQTPDDAPTAPSAAIGRYEIIAELARGGMGVVYRAFDPALKRPVALKVIKEGDADPQLVARLHREAATAAKLRHPNIVAVHEVGEADGQSYIAMDLVEGGSLRRAEFAPRRFVEILEQVARAVHYAHENGVIHRDLKPDNVLLDGDRPLVADFGLARVEGSSLALTRSGGVMGTPLYMAPEQVRGETAGPRADVYALGVMLYERLAGRLPFDHPNIEQLFFAILDGNALRPSDVRAGVDRDLETVAMKAMALDPADRYETADALADDLKRWLDGVPVRARPLSPMTRAARWTKRRPALAAMAVAVMILSLFVLWNTISTPRRVAQLHEATHRLVTLADGSIARFDDILMGPPRNLDKERADLGRAADSLRAAYAENPRLHEALIHIGRIEAKLGRFADSEKSINEGLGRLGPSASGVHYLSRALLRIEEIFDPAMRTDSRIDELKKLARADLAEARRRGLALMPEVGKYVEAVVCFVSLEPQAALANCNELLAAKGLDPTLRADALRLKAFACWTLNDTEAARAAIDEAVVIKRSDAAMLVVAATMSRDAARARTATMIAPQWHAAWLALGAWTPDVDEAADALDRANALAPRNAAVLSERARNALSRGKPEDAIREAEAALAVDAADVLARMTRADAKSVLAEGDLARRKELADAALAAYDELVAERPDDPDVLTGRGLVLRKGGMFAWEGGASPESFWTRALEDLERAQRAGPHADAASQEGWVRYTLAEYRRAQRREDDAAKIAADAETAFDRALRTQSGHVLARLGRATTRLFRSNPEGALADAEQLPGEAKAHALRGDALFALQRWKEAVDAWDRAMELDPRLKPALTPRRDEAKLK